MKKVFSFLFVFIFLGFGFFYAIKPIYDSINFPENMFVTISDIENANNNSNFSPFFKFSLPEDLEVGSEDVSSTQMDIKLFGWFPIKRVKVKLLNDVDVFVGGNTVGFYLNSDGVIVSGTNPIYTENGNVVPLSNSIQNGDRIIKINNIEIKDIEDIDKILNNENSIRASAGSVYTVNLEIERKNKILNLEIQPALDLWTKKYKLGLWVKNSASGVGTLTYIKKSNNRFGGVGHAISGNGMESSALVNGDVYLCNYLGIKKGSPDNPGEIMTSINISDNEIGIADTNCEYGVYGNILNKTCLDLSRSANLGGRMSVKMGDAKIYCDLDGNGVEAFDIKIIKANHQKKANEKSIMFKVTDKDLIAKTGGIIQGMSGSPIVQDGKLIGAVTHVFLNDPTKAFGVYIDWMIDN
ncbi:MAG: SpoIVB peptidase [Clostridia bacterium]|nr:SpoIVB peptidase [Clostridia bacterium]